MKSSTPPVAPVDEATSASSLQAALGDELEFIWARTYSIQIRRLESLEVALSSIEAGDWNAALVETALRQIHKLAGSLGTFGLAAASRQAARAERILASGPARGPRQAHTLRRLVASMHKDLDSRPRVASVRARKIASTSRAPNSDLLKRVDLVVIDDDPTLTEAIAACAATIGFSIRCFSAGAAALAALAGEPVELAAGVILLDIDMPGMDGFAVLRQLQERAVVPTTPVILFTQRSTSHDVLRALDFSIRGYLAKPVWMPDLFERIHQALGSPQGLFVDGPAHQ